MKITSIFFLFILLFIASSQLIACEFIFEGPRGYNWGNTSELDRIIERNPQDAGAYYMRGRIRSEYGNKSGAIEDFTNAIIYNPKNPDIFPNLAAAYSARGQEYRLLASMRRENPDSQIKLYQKAISDLTEAASIMKRQGDIYGYKLEMDHIEWIEKELLLPLEQLQPTL